MRPSRYQPLTTGKAGRAATEASILFLMDLWVYEPDACTFIGTRCGERWQDHVIRGEDRAAQISKILEDRSSDRFDIYFCPNAFSQPNRRAALALPSRYAWCDIDDADPAGYHPQPNILWETSPGRFQGIWIWRESAEGKLAEQYSRTIVYKDGGDKSGWSITKMLRVPGTINHKAGYDRPVVTLRSFYAACQKLPKSISDIEPSRRGWATRDGSEPFDEIDPFKHDPNDVIGKYRKRMSPFPRSLLIAGWVIYPDKSNALYAVITELVRLAATNNEIASVLRENPHFTHRDGMTLKALCADILRIRAKWEKGQ
jgi:hypothetical protein